MLFNLASLFLKPFEFDEFHDACDFWKIHYILNFLKEGSYSTIDSSIMVAGAYFAGNYFGGELADLARTIGTTPQ